MTDVVLARKLAEAMELAIEIRDGEGRRDTPVRLVIALNDCFDHIAPGSAPGGVTTATSWPTSKPRGRNRRGDTAPPRTDAATTCRGPGVGAIVRCRRLAALATMAASPRSRSWLGSGPHGAGSGDAGARRMGSTYAP
jgi:hypothetical protein